MPGICPCKFCHFFPSTRWSRVDNGFTIANVIRLDESHDCGSDTDEAEALTQLNLSVGGVAGRLGYGRGRGGGSTA